MIQQLFKYVSVVNLSAELNWSLGKERPLEGKVGAAAFFKGPGWVLSHGSASIPQGLFDIPLVYFYAAFI